MNYRWTGTAAAVLLALGAAGTAFAQGTSRTAGGTGLDMPWQRGFWGHAGISVGQSDLKADCPPGGFSCDDKDTTWRIFGGGRFNNIVGGEIGYVNFGEFARGGGDTDAQGIDLALIAGVPFGPNRNWSVFGKLGGIWSETDASGTAPGFETGKADGWGWRYGLGLQAGLTENWAIRADWDRYRVEFRQGDEDIDTLTVGVQYTFR